MELSSAEQIKSHLKHCGAANSIVLQGIQSAIRLFHFEDFYFGFDWDLRCEAQKGHSIIACVVGDTANRSLMVNELIRE